MPTANPDTGQAKQAALLDSLQARSDRAWQAAQAAWARAQAIQARQAEAAKLRPRHLLTVSLVARLQAQLATMPVIEQAKGVLMAQQGCDADQAFDLLRRASQRSNVPVRELAERIVKNAQQHRSVTKSASEVWLAGRFLISSGQPRVALPAWEVSAVACNGVPSARSVSL